MREESAVLSLRWVLAPFVSNLHWNANTVGSYNSDVKTKYGGCVVPKLTELTLLTLRRTHDGDVCEWSTLLHAGNGSLHQKWLQGVVVLSATHVRKLPGVGSFGTSKNEDVVST